VYGYLEGWFNDVKYPDTWHLSQV